MPLRATSFINSFMAKKKPRSSTDELAVVKAAAWAWFQRGSGSDSEGKCIGEFDVARSQRFVSKPSRYKLEAMKITKEEGGEEEDYNTNNTLLDKYEIESISKRFDQLLNSNAATELLKNVSQDSGSTNNNNTNGMMMMMMNDNKKAKKSKGFWLSRHGVLCGTRQDAVVDARFYNVFRRPDKPAPVVRPATCPPRVPHA